MSKPTLGVEEVVIGVRDNVVAILEYADGIPLGFEFLDYHSFKISVCHNAIVFKMFCSV